jgi:hypothetical protein
MEEAIAILKNFDIQIEVDKKLEKWKIIEMII